jgi:hypothetical protein
MMYVVDSLFVLQCLLSVVSVVYRFYNVHLIHVTVDIIDNRYRQKQYRRHHEHALTKTALKQTSTNVSSRDRQHSLLTTDTAEQIHGL